MIPGGQVGCSLDLRDGHLPICLDLVLLNPPPVLSIQIDYHERNDADDVEGERDDDRKEGRFHGSFPAQSEIPDRLEQTELAGFPFEHTPPGCVCTVRTFTSVSGLVRR